MKNFTVIYIYACTLLFGLGGCSSSTDNVASNDIYYSTETDNRLIFEKLVLSLDKHQHAIEFFPSNPLVKTKVLGKPELAAPNTVGALKNTIVNSVNEALIVNGVSHLSPITRENIEVFGGRHVNTVNAYRNEMPLLARPNGEPYRIKISFLDPNQKTTVKKVAEGNFSIYSTDTDTYSSDSMPANAHEEYTTESEYETISSQKETIEPEDETITIEEQETTIAKDTSVISEENIW